MPEKQVQIVPESKARTIAENFNPTVYYKLSNPSNHSPFICKLNGSNQIESEYTITDNANLPAMYVYNFANNNGFLFISADYQMQPILGYVEKGEFKLENAPGGFIMWLNKTIDNIEIAREGLYDNSKLATASWNNYLLNSASVSIASRDSASATPLGLPNPPPPNPCATNPNYTSSTTVTVGPLLPVEWGQEDTYNNLCPNDGCANSEDRDAPTGCGATAMAMVIRYWQYPANKYNYAVMPTDYGDINVQHLMQDAGTSVGMKYACSGSSISDAYFAGVLISSKSVAQQIGDALRGSYFGYSSATSELNGNLYGSDGYITIQSNIYYGEPVILNGSPAENDLCGCPTSAPGHIWVCDGTSATTITFCENGTEIGEGLLTLHMNWGWQEYQQTTNYNGWFNFENWYIPQILTSYNYYDEMTYNIHP